jgi:hypothetical protein
MVVTVVEALDGVRYGRVTERGIQAILPLMSGVLIMGCRLRVTPGGVLGGMYAHDAGMFCEDYALRS